MQLENISDSELIKLKLSLESKISALDGEQMALKILANSLFGACGNSGFRYYDIHLAEAITLSGQWCNRTVMARINAYLNKLCGTTGVDYVITGDTDSTYLDLGAFVNKFYPNNSDEDTVNFILKSIPKFQKVISGAIDDIFTLCNGMQRSISYKPEAVASKGFFTKKKKYALKIHNSEGVMYKTPKLKVTGLELIKTSTPAVIRASLKKALPIIFDEGETALQAYVAECRDKFRSYSIEEISFPRGVSDIDKWYAGPGKVKSGCPIAVRGSIMYNKLVENMGEKYTPIVNGDKIRFIYLKMPNPIKENVISFPADASFPRINNLEKYVDWDLQFEKVFMSPMNGLTTSLSWNAEHRSSLCDFM